MSHAPLVTTHARGRSSARLVLRLVPALALAACGPASPPQPPADTTPPTVISSQPTAGDDNVSASLPITVRFSEALDPATVTDATVQLAGDGSVNLAKSLALAGDVLTITPVSTLSLPETLTLNLTGGIADPAGNALEAASWSWTVPAWLRLGDDPVLAYAGTFAIYWSHLELGADGLPVVAGNREEAPQALLRRWDGEAWREMPPPNGEQGNSFIHDLAMDGDDVVVAWSGHLGEVFDPDFYVSRWDGEAWTLLGGGLTEGDVYPEEAALAVASTGDPVIAFSQKVSPGNSAADLLVRRWTGSAWEALGGKLEVNDTAILQDIELVLDHDDDPIVAWGERVFDASYVKAWDPTLQAWQQLGPSLSNSQQAASLVVRASGELVAALNAPDGTIRLSRYVAPSWQPLGPPLRRLASRTTSTPSLAESAAGQIVVGWSEHDFTTSETAVSVATLVGGSWSFVGEEIGASPPAFLSNVALRLLDGSTPAVSYTRYRPHDDDPTVFDNETIYRFLNE